MEEGKKVYIRPNGYGEDKNIQLKNKPARILKVLLERADCFVSNSTIIDEVWDGYAVDTPRLIRTMDVHLVSIRAFLEDSESNYEILRVRGAGIILKTG